MTEPQKESLMAMRHSKIIGLIFDFDGTLTKKDTMHLVARAGYTHQDNEQRKPPPTPWNEIVEAYMSDSKAHADTYAPKPDERTTLAQESAWLNSLKPVEQASFERAAKAGVFDNVEIRDIDDVAQQVLQSGELQLRPRWQELMAIVQQHNTQLQSDNKPETGGAKVVSVNWSRYFIKSVLQHNRKSNEALNGTQFVVPQIYANELESLLKGCASEDGATSTLWHEPLQIRTSGDKLQLLKIWDQAAREGGTVQTLIYVGDSSTDLECLAEADVGICIRDDPLGSGQQELANVCARIGIEVNHIRECKLNYQYKQHMSSGRLWWAKDFFDIQQWLEQQLRLP